MFCVDGASIRAPPWQAAGTTAQLFPLPVAVFMVLVRITSDGNMVGGSHMRLPVLAGATSSVTAAEAASVSPPPRQPAEGVAHARSGAGASGCRTHCGALRASKWAY